ncbi:hypothetical protein [Bradyrhizobium sp. HKCCYLRH1030]|uniref:hypothetical protein n=1 Tax=Bradyrhizobium sp. HKCCYLRH1030 TaxID=3420744 RepID=UPI003EB9162E
MACQDRSVLMRADERFWQDGEIVRSRHPDADAKLALTLRAGDGGYKPDTEERTYKP